MARFDSLVAASVLLMLLRLAAPTLGWQPSQCPGAALREAAPAAQLRRGGLYQRRRQLGGNKWAAAARTGEGGGGGGEGGEGGGGGGDVAPTSRRRVLGAALGAATAAAAASTAGPTAALAAEGLELGGFDLPRLPSLPSLPGQDPGTRGPFGPVPTDGLALKSGVKIIDYEAGTGKFPKYGQLVRFKYVGYAKRSQGAPLVKFDSTFDRGNTLLIIKHGNGRLIQGLDEALHSMKVGGKRRVVIPPQLGYIQSGLGPFPPDADKRRILNGELDKLEADGAIVFDVQLVEAFDDDADPGYYDDGDLPPQVMNEVFSRIEAVKSSIGPK